MFARVAPLAVLAALGLFVSTRHAEACGHHRVTTTVYCPCSWAPCPCVPYCFGPVYVVSPPSVPLFDKPITPTPLRTVPFGKGVIVEFTAPTGTANAMPTGLIQVIKTGGTGEMKYEGYHVQHPVPGRPGAPYTYSVLLLPTTPGKIDVKVGFVLSNNEIVNHTLSFDVVPVVYQP